MKNPCVRDCPRRSATCHSYCPEYAKFDQYNQMRRQESHMKTILSDHSPTRYANFIRHWVQW